MRRPSVRDGKRDGPHTQGASVSMKPDSKRVSRAILDTQRDEELPPQVPQTSTTTARQLTESAASESALAGNALHKERRFVQAHFWLTRADLTRLKRAARRRDQSESAVMRRLVRSLPDDDE